MMNKLLTLILILVVGRIAAQDEMDFTLEKALSYALENNYTIANAELDVDAAEKKIWETTAIGLPQASAKVAYQNTFEVPSVSFGSYVDYMAMDLNQPITPALIFENTKEGESIPLGVQENVTADITVNQLIFNGSYIVGLQASRTYKELSQRALEKSKQEISEAVENLFYLCLIMDERIENLQANLEEQKKVRDEFKAMLNEGFIEDTEFDQMVILVNNLSISVNNLEQLKEVSYNQLKLVMGLSLDKKIKLIGDLETYFNRLEQKDYFSMSFDLSKNIDYQLTSSQVRLSSLNLKNKQAEFLPVLSAFYNYQYQMDEPEFSFAIPHMLGVNLQVPIMSSGMKLAQVGQARIELEKDQNNQWQLVQNLEIEFIQAKADYYTAAEKQKNEKVNLELAEKIYKRTSIKQKNGMASSMDLSNAQSQYLTAQTNYYEALFQLLSAKVKLEKLLGTINN